MKEVELTADLLEKITPEQVKIFATEHKVRGRALFVDFDWRKLGDEKSAYFLDFRQRLWAHMNDTRLTQLYEPLITELKSGRPTGEPAKAKVVEHLEAKGQKAAAMKGSSATAKSPGAANVAKEADYVEQTLKNLKRAERGAAAKSTADALKKKLLTREGISETLSKENARKLEGWAKARPVWMKLAVGTGLAIGAIGVINRVAVGNDHPPDDVERAWARIEKVRGRMAKQRREDWSDFGSPWGGKFGKKLISALAGAAEAPWAKRGMNFSSVGERIARAIPRRGGSLSKVGVAPLLEQEDLMKRYATERVYRQAYNRRLNPQLLDRLAAKRKVTTLERIASNPEAQSLIRAGKGTTAIMPGSEGMVFAHNLAIWPNVISQRAVFGTLGNQIAATSSVIGQRAGDLHMAFKGTAASGSYRNVIERGGLRSVSGGTKRQSKTIEEMARHARLPLRPGALTDELFVTPSKIVGVFSSSKSEVKEEAKKLAELIGVPYYDVGAHSSIATIPGLNKGWRPKGVPTNRPDKNNEVLQAWKGAVRHTNARPHRNQKLFRFS